ncbi:MAG: trigger factor [Planctomycetia bacterium]|nr:trigger factor [Planctomycetia bacterium]
MAEDNLNDVQNAEETKLNVKFNIEEKSACERHITAEVGRDEIDRYFDREFAELQQNASIPGFRAGKAPRKMIEKRFRKDVVTRVKNSLILDVLTQANDELSLTPISEPDLVLDKVELPEEGNFIFEYNVEVRPTFDIPNWKGLTLERPVRTFTSADVDAAIVRLQHNYSTLEKKDGAAEAGDFIDAKISFELDGKVLNSADHEKVRIRQTLSFHDCTITEFDKLMIGVKAGDTRETTVTISEGAQNAALRGKDVKAIFVINEVLAQVLPEVDEKFIRQLGDFQDMGDFRDAVQETLERQLEYDQNQRARRQITAQLLQGADWDLPPKLLESQSAREFQRAIYEMQRSGFSDQQIISQINSLRQNCNASTAQALKEHFILEAIAESEGIEDTADDYTQELMLMSAQTGESVRRLRSQIEKSGNMDVLRNQIIERKVINLIKESAEFKETPYVLQEIDEEALDVAASQETSEIPEVTEEDAKAAAREAAEGK